MTDDKWEVVFDEPVDRTNLAAGTETIARGYPTEAGARDGLAEVQRNAKSLTYSNIKLRHNGVFVD